HVKLQLSCGRFKRNEGSRAPLRAVGPSAIEASQKRTRSREWTIIPGGKGIHKKSVPPRTFLKRLAGYRDHFPGAGAAQLLRAGWSSEAGSPAASPTAPAKRVQVCGPLGRQIADGRQPTESSSTSNTRVALGGMTGGYP